MTDAGTGVAVAQFAPVADEAANLAQIAALVERAVDRGASLVLLPEYANWFADPFDSRLAEHAQDLDGPFATALIELAARADVTIVSGMVERGTGDGRVHNTVVAVDGSGMLASYRKMHLYDAYGQRESDWVEPGEVTEAATFLVNGLRCGLMTCYDLRFPEVTRTLADADAHLVLVPAEWVRGPLKEHHWRTLLRARAIENTFYVAAADHAPPIGVGLSMIVDPTGVDIAGVGTATDVALAWPSRAAIDRVREVNPALALRRFRVVPR